MRNVASLVLLSLLGLAACSSASSRDDHRPGSPQHHEPPQGCQRTACNVDADRCRQSGSIECQRCRNDCAQLSIEYRYECIKICAETCAAKTDSARACDDREKACVASSPRNAFCADGVEDACVPEPSLGRDLPRVAAHATACTAKDVDDLLSSCFGASATTSKCETFVSAHYSCVKCASGTTGAEPLWRPDAKSSIIYPNVGLCVALHGDVDCGGAIYGATSCAQSACRACAHDDGSCVDAAFRLSCDSELAKSDACVAALPDDVRADCLFPEDGSGDFLAWAARNVRLACTKR